MDLELTGLFSLHGVFTLAMLIMLQAVLGFDNLLYISLESKRVEESKQSYVRKLGVGLAIFLRLALLIVLLLAIERMQTPLFQWPGIFNTQVYRREDTAAIQLCQIRAWLSSLPA